MFSMEYLPIIGIIFAAIIFVILFVSSYKKASPSEAIRISGLGKPKLIIGRAGFKLPFFQRSDKLSLEVFQVDIKTSEIPTREFINIDVDGVANLKISSNPEMLEKAFESILLLDKDSMIKQIQQVLQGNMREIIGTISIKELVQDRQGVADKVKQNVVPDMAKLGIELVNFNIQSFDDREDVVKNLGIDNIATISRDAAIAKAKADADVRTAQAEASERANAAEVLSKKKITEQNTELTLTQASLKVKADTAKAEADAAYDIERQRRQEQINIATVNANIAQREREVELGNKEVELTERKLEAEIKKTAEAKRYADQQSADAKRYVREQEAEAKKFEQERDAEARIIAAEASKKTQAAFAEATELEAKGKAAATIAIANSERDAALANAQGIEATGKAEAIATEKKAEAMKKFGEASTLQMILDSGVLPEIVAAYAEPIAAALSKIDSITMYGEGNQAKLVEEISTNGDQLFAGLEKSLGLDVKSLIAGYFGGKLLNKANSENNEN